MQNKSISEQKLRKFEHFITEQKRAAAKYNLYTNYL